METKTHVLKGMESPMSPREQAAWLWEHDRKAVSGFQSLEDLLVYVEREGLPSGPGERTRSDSLSEMCETSQAIAAEKRRLTGLSDEQERRICEAHITTLKERWQQLSERFEACLKRDGEA